MSHDPTESSPWNWPAEWAVDRSFWREVATRTIAGVLTVIIIGAPALIWAAFTGVFTWDVAAPILIGVALFIVMLAIYVTFLVIIRAIARRKGRDALVDANASEYNDVSTRDIDVILFSVGRAKANRPKNAFDPRTARSLSSIRRLSVFFNILAGVVTIVSFIIGITNIIPIVLR